MGNNTLLTAPADLHDKYVASNVLSIKSLIDIESRRVIRQCFDLGMIDTNAIACIQVANELGHHDLAKEMIANMKEMEVQNA